MRRVQVQQGFPRLNTKLSAVYARLRALASFAQRSSPAGAKPGSSPIFNTAWAVCCRGLSSLLAPLRPKKGKVHPSGSPPWRMQVGQAGEQAAAEFLRAKGYRVWVRNWRKGPYELDLVCRDGPVLVCVEVRTRAPGALTPGAASVSKKKRLQVAKAFALYRQSLQVPIRHFRTDWVQVEGPFPEGHYHLIHYPGTVCG